MSRITEDNYKLWKPGGAVTAISISGDINVFGCNTTIKTTDIRTYPRIGDEPQESAEYNSIWDNLAIGVAATVVLAAVAITALPTGGASVAAGSDAISFTLLRRLKTTIFTCLNFHNLRCRQSA